jgi:hypothetical protein
MGITGIEFCDYEHSMCPFGYEYCTCKDLDMDNSKMKPQKMDDDLTF